MTVQQLKELLKENKRFIDIIPTNEFEVKKLLKDLLKNHKDLLNTLFKNSSELIEFLKKYETLLCDSKQDNPNLERDFIQWLFTKNALNNLVFNSKTLKISDLIEFLNISIIQDVKGINKQNLLACLFKNDTLDKLLPDRNDKRFIDFLNTSIMQNLDKYDIQNLFSQILILLLYDDDYKLTTSTLLNYLNTDLIQKLDINYKARFFDSFINPLNTLISDGMDPDYLICLLKTPVIKDLILHKKERLLSWAFDTNTLNSFINYSYDLNTILNNYIIIFKGSLDYSNTKKLFDLLLNDQLLDKNEALKIYLKYNVFKNFLKNNKEFYNTLLKFHKFNTESIEKIKTVFSETNYIIPNIPIYPKPQYIDIGSKLKNSISDITPPDATPIIISSVNTSFCFKSCCVSSIQVTLPENNFK